MGDKASDAWRAGASAAIEYLAAGYERDGNFGSFCELIPGWERSFTFADWRTALVTIPRMRWELLLSLPWNAIAPRRRHPGLSHPYTPGKRFNFSHRSFCDLLIWEAILDAAEHFGVRGRSDYASRASDCVEMARKNSREVTLDGGKLDLYSYFPARDHLIDRNSAVWKWFLSIDASVPDNDSTSIVLSCLLGLGRRLGGMDRSGPDADENLQRFLALLEAHLYGCGRFGQGALSYRNGVTKDDNGVVTWLFDHHNEVDPTSNVNILQFLSVVAGYLPNSLERVHGLSRRISGFLDRHADSPEFLAGRLQQYYPPGSVFFFWYRLQSALKRLSASERSAFDPQGALDRIDAKMALAAPELLLNPGRAHLGDILLSAPFLAAHGLLDASLKSRLASADTWLSHFSDHHYETFHLLYPVKMVCIAKNLPVAAYLYTLMELDTSQNPIPISR